MLDFKNVIASAKIYWLKRYLTFEQNDWRLFFEYFLKVQNPNIFVRSNFSLKDIPTNLPEYYRDCFLEWHKLRMKQTKEAIDFIWYNSDIKVGKQAVYCENMFMCGIWTVHDLFN